MDPDGDRVMSEQTRLRADMNVVDAYCQGQPTTWAGIQWDNDEPIRIAAYFTGDLDDHRAALSSLVMHPDRVDVRPARHTMIELDAMREQIHDLLTASGGGWTTGSGVDVVVVGLAPAAEHCRAQLVRRFGEVVEFEPWQGPRKLAER